MLPEAKTSKKQPPTTLSEGLYCMEIIIIQGIQAFHLDSLEYLLAFCVDPPKSVMRLTSKASLFRKTRLGELAIDLAISRAASIRRSSAKAGFFCIAAPTIFTAADSPWAWMIFDFRSCSAISTRYLARSAS